MEKLDLVGQHQRYAIVNCFRASVDNNIFTSHASEAKSLLDLRASFESKTVQLYTEILKYEIRVACQYSRSTPHRILRDAVLADDWTTMLDHKKRRIKELRVI